MTIYKCGACDSVQDSADMSHACGITETFSWTGEDSGESFDGMCSRLLRHGGQQNPFWGTVRVSPYVISALLVEINLLRLDLGRDIIK